MTDFSLVVGPTTYVIRSSMKNERYSSEGFARALTPVLDRWGTLAPVLKFLVSEEVKLFIFLVDLEDSTTVSITLLDAIDVSRVDLTMDPRKIPARIGDRSYSPIEGSRWDTVLLLCIFEMLSRYETITDGKYTLWGAIDVSVEVVQQVFRNRDGTLGSDDMVLVVDLVAPPVSYESDVQV